MGLDPTLKTQLHLRQAFPVTLSKKWSGRHTPVTKQKLTQVSTRSSPTIHGSFVLITKHWNKADICRWSMCSTAENALIPDKWMQSASKRWHFQTNVGKLKWRLRSGITLRDNHCFSQSAIKNPRVPNQAWLLSYTKWFIISTLQLLISYYSDKLRLMITEEMKVGFMTLEPMAKDRECLKSVLGEKPSSHLCTWW